MKLTADGILSAGFNILMINMRVWNDALRTYQVSNPLCNMEFSADDAKGNKIVCYTKFPIHGFPYCLF